MNFEQIILEFFNFNKENFNDIIKLIALILLTIHILIIFWVINDINKRTNNPFSKILSVFCVLVPVLSIPGLVAYLLFRPHQTLEEKQESKLYHKKDIVLIEPNLQYCANCFGLNKKEYKFCIDCGEQLERNCDKCQCKVDPTWMFCPLCQNKIGEFEVEGFFKRLRKKIANTLRSIREFFGRVFSFYKSKLPEISTKPEVEIIIPSELKVSEERAVKEYVVYKKKKKKKKNRR